MVGFYAAPLPVPTAALQIIAMAQFPWLVHNALEDTKWSDLKTKSSVSSDTSTYILLGGKWYGMAKGTYDQYGADFRSLPHFSTTGRKGLI